MDNSQLLISKLSSIRPSYVSCVSIGVIQSVLRSRKMAESIEGDSSRRASFGSGSVSRRILIWLTRRYKSEVGGRQREVRKSKSSAARLRRT